jgi:hypothetical protein
LEAANPRGPRGGQADVGQPIAAASPDGSLPGERGFGSRKSRRTVLRTALPMSLARHVLRASHSASRVQGDVFMCEHIVPSDHHIFAHRFPFVCIVLSHTHGICLGLDCVGPCLSTTCELLSKSHIFKIKTKLTIKIVCLFLSKKKTVRPNCTNNFNIHLCTHKISNGRHNTPFVLVYKVICFLRQTLTNNLAN